MVSSRFGAPIQEMKPSIVTITEEPLQEKSKDTVQTFSPTTFGNHVKKQRKKNLVCHKHAICQTQRSPPQTAKLDGRVAHHMRYYANQRGLKVRNSSISKEEIFSDSSIECVP